jgi:hypothetical protein
MEGVVPDRSRTASFSDSTPSNLLYSARAAFGLFASRAERAFWVLAE